MNKSPESQQENPLQDFSSVISLGTNLQIDLDSEVLIRESERKSVWQS